MEFQGYKIKVSCTDWEQVDILSDFWDTAATVIEREKLTGLGMEWSNNYFTYAIGMLNEDKIPDGLGEKLQEAGFSIEPIQNMKLPASDQWQEFSGSENNLQKIYETEIDCYNKKYDYELEFFDGKGNVKIMIHYIGN